MRTQVLPPKQLLLKPAGALTSRHSALAMQSLFGNWKQRLRVQNTSASPPTQLRERCKPAPKPSKTNASS
jgi:hypothetical protein